MPKSKLMRILLVAGSVLIVVGVALMTWMLTTEDERSVIEVQLFDGRTSTEEIKFEGLALVPGQECEYDIVLKSDNADTYEMRFDFVETAESPLKNFACVKIMANDTVVRDELLDAAFTGEELVLPVEFTSQEKVMTLKVIYYLPLEVGNEAKNAGAQFKLVLTASNE